MSDSTVTAVEILGERYQVRGASSERISALAEYVDQKFRELQQSGHSIDMKRQAVLVSLNIAEEVFAERDLRGEEIESVRYRLRQCREFLAEVEAES